MTGARGLDLPVAIVGGYLGAGKTTLINHLLHNAAGRRLALLVNDFGAINIDADLIEGRDEDVIRLAGGCVCCGLSENFATAIVDMLARPETFDQIIVEASGVARPDAMAAAASMLPGVFLSAVVIVADARSVRARASDRYVGDLITAQLQAGDYVLLNKIDQISPDQLRREEAWLRQICPQTPLIAATGAEIDPNLILDPLPGASARGGSIAREGAPADEAFVSFTFSLPNSVDADRLGARLARPDKGLLRAKGFVLDAARGAQVLQVVGRRWSVSAPAIGARPVARVVTCIALRARLDLAYLSSLRAQFEL